MKKYWFRQKLCSVCKTGKYMYELDGHSSECPYLGYLNGNKCSMYSPLEKKKNCFFRRAAEKRNVFRSKEN